VFFPAWRLRLTSKTPSNTDGYPANGSGDHAGKNPNERNRIAARYRYVD
jgi:hypothetical protein